MNVLTSRLRTIIFDCGRVITCDQDMGIAARMAAVFGSETGDFINAYAAERGDYDRGTLAVGDYWMKVARRLDSEIDGGDVGNLVELDQRSWFTINGETVRIIRELKENGFRLLILSNMNFEGKDEMFGRSRVCGGVDWIALFDEIILSCDLKLLKPEPEIYKACLEKADALPGECLFIDDTPANIKAARECGIHGIVFSRAERLRAALRDEYGALKGGF